MRWLVSFALLVFASCASTTVKPISSQTVDDDCCEIVGFRYYESSPYILVTADGKTGLKSELIYLPDPTKKRSVELSEFLASNNATLTFTDGVLTSAKNKGDAAVVPKAIVDAAKAVAVALAGAAPLAVLGDDTKPERPEPFKAPGPVLFKLKNDPAAGWILIRSDRQYEVEVNVPEAEP